MAIVVVGAGVSGLTVAHGLVRRGLNVTVLEQSRRVGGMVRTESAEGYQVEGGPNSLLDREPQMRALLSELGLESAIEPASPAANQRFVYVDGQLQQVPRAPPGFLATGLIPFGAKLRALGDLFQRPRRSADDESLHAFFSRHFGDHVSRTLVDAVQTGIFAGDPERLSARACFPPLVELEATSGSVIRGMIAQQKERRRALPPGEKPKPAATYSFRGGLSVLTDALAGKLGDAVQLGAVVERISRDGARWKVEWTRDGQRTTTSTEAVLLATPAYLAAPLLEPVAPQLASELAGIEFASVSTVHLGYAQADCVQVPQGFGAVLPERAGRRVIGIIFTSSVFPSRAPSGHRLFTVLVGGARHPERARQSEAELIQLAREELSVILGLRAEPRLARAFRWDRAIPQYNLGHLERLARIDARLAQLPHLGLLGYSYRGVGINDCVREARRAAEAFVMTR